MKSGVPKNTRRHLEWDAVLARLAEHCRGPVAVDAALALEPATDAAELAERLARVSEARALVDAGRLPPVGDAPDVSRPLSMAARGAVLDPEELRSIGVLVESSARCIRYLAESNTPHLAAVGERLCDLPGLGRNLLDSFDESGGVLDSASGELGQLRTRVAQLHEQLKQRVHGLLSDPAYNDLLQDDYYTIREDRYVLPIRSGHKRHVPGIVHGWSATGQTVYIEPQAVVEANNKLLMAQAEVDREIRRILARLSKQVGAHSREIGVAQAALGELDLALAAGRLSRELEGSEPVIVEETALALTAARHPLLCLAGGLVVANDIELSPPHRVLVVTGPNTGGKTVAVKTSGLCVLMALCGLHIPAAPGSRVPRVPGVFTDIGDEQSLDDGQSTFSGHIANILAIFAAIEPGSLVLLDELAVGTDPVQGAALAQAVLEAFAERETMVLVTTHFESLKVLSYDDERFRNGAVGYDRERRAPTYVLTLDVPGASSALQTARRLGLDGAIVDRAAELTGPQQRRLEATIEDLETQRQAAINAREAVEAERVRLEAARARVEQQEDKLRERLRTGLAKERDEALQAARKLRDDVRRLERALRNPEKRSEPAFLADARVRAEKAVSELSEAKHAAERIAAGPAPAATELRIGQRLWVVSLGIEAELVEGPDDRGRCRVRAGILTAVVDAGDLRPRGGAAPAAEKPRPRRAPAPQTIQWEDAPPQATHNTVDVRGHRVEEALERVEKFLDAAYEKDEPIAFVIHGHGTGALKKAVRDFLRESRYVRDQRRGERGEGGDGVTAALLS